MPFILAHPTILESFSQYGIAELRQKHADEIAKMRNKTDTKTRENEKLIKIIACLRMENAYLEQTCHLYYDAYKTHQTFMQKHSDTPDTLPA